MFINNYHRENERLLIFFAGLFTIDCNHLLFSVKRTFILMCENKHKIFNITHYIISWYYTMVFNQTMYVYIVCV